MKTRRIAETNSATATLEAPEPVTVHTEPVAESRAPSALAFRTPNVLTNLPGTDASDVPQSQGGVFLSAAHPLSNNWPACQAAGVKEGDFFVTIDGEILKQMPARFHFVQGYRGFTKMSKTGAILETSREEEDGMEEHYTALLVLEIDGKLYPSRSDFRGPKSGAIAPAFRALAEASDPEFATKSDAHRIAAQFPHPWGRFVLTATTNPQTARGSGNRYYRGRATVSPPTMAEMQRLADAFNDPEFLAQFAEAADSYSKRVKEIGG